MGHYAVLWCLFTNHANTVSECRRARAVNVSVILTEVLLHIT
jgi:hypothetical protein